MNTMATVGSSSTKKGRIGSMVKIWPPTKLKKQEDISPVIENMPMMVPALAPAPLRGFKSSIKSITPD